MYILKELLSWFAEYTEPVHLAFWRFSYATVLIGFILKTIVCILISSCSVTKNKGLRENYQNL